MEEKNSFVFYRSFLEALRDLDAEDFKEAVIALAEYGMDKKEPSCSGVVKAVFTLSKPILDTNYQNWLNSKNGGRPKKNREETEIKPNKNRNENEMKPTENQSETEPLPYVDVDVIGNMSNKKSKGTRTKPDKLIFGEYGHVRLTVEQYDKLGVDLGENMREAAIKRLDEYIQERPDYKSKDHNLAIRRWVVKAVEEAKEKPTIKSKQTTFHNFDMKHDYDYEAMEKELLRRE